MWAEPIVQQLTDGRLHLSHGPIDLVFKAWGRPAEVAAAHHAATVRFETILTELCAELVELRRPLSAMPVTSSPVACRMLSACRPFASEFITPMAAVAGAVADEVLWAMTSAADLDKAFVNDGGDIALHVAAGHSLSLGVGLLGEEALEHSMIGRIQIGAADGIAGVATSGARGRSFSLGIADSVTVLAANAASADAAATLVANAVNVDSSAVRRASAVSLDPDSDLGHRLVTVAVGPLDHGERCLALDRGCERAREYIERGLVAGAALLLAGDMRLVGDRLREQAQVRQSTKRISSEVLR